MRSLTLALAAMAMFFAGTSGAQAAIGTGMDRLAGKWGGCLDGEDGYFTFTRQGKLTVTNGNDEDLFSVHADVFERTRRVRFFPEHLVLLVPEVDDDGEIDVSVVTPIPISFLDRDHISIRPDLDYEVYVLRRAGARAGAACKGERNVARLLEAMRKLRR